MIELIITIAIVAFLLWLVGQFTPIPQPFKNIVYVIIGICAVVVAICLLLYVLRATGIWHGGDIPVSQIR